MAAINEASLRGQIDATNQLITINKKMLDILQAATANGLRQPQRRGLAGSSSRAGRGDPAAAAQGAGAASDLLAALTGSYPSQEPRETFKLADLSLPADLPVSLPSLLIEQRPDVRAAQEQLHSASAQIGVAIANMLPNFTISGNAGLRDTMLAGLINPVNVFWLIAGNATQTVFDAGTLLHRAAGAQAPTTRRRGAIAGTVVAAVQNVADSLRAVQNDADALKAARDFERAAKISLDLAQQQMQTGYANILILLTAQQTYLQATIQVVQARAARLADTATLYQALGGGWWNRVEPPTEKVLNAGTGEAATFVDEHDRLFEWEVPPLFPDQPKRERNNEDDDNRRFCVHCVGERRHRGRRRSGCYSWATRCAARLQQCEAQILRLERILCRH